MIRSVAAAAALLLSLPLVAQTVDFDVLVDTDRNPGSGCSVTPSGGAPLGGFEQRIRASVDLASLEVVALARASCSGAAFGPPIAISDFPVPYPLALNTATSGGDAVELAVATSVLGLGGLRELRLAFVADNGTTSDVLSTVDGQRQRRPDPVRSAGSDPGAVDLGPGRAGADTAGSGLCGASPDGPGRCSNGGSACGHRGLGDELRARR